MAIRFYFKNEVLARQAVSLCFCHQSWAYTFKSGLPDGAVCGVETSELNEGLITSAFKEDLV